MVAWWIARGISRAPLGRALRAVRDSESAVAALGREPERAADDRRSSPGGFLGGLSGGLLVEYVSAGARRAGSTGETFLFFTALIVGGKGNLAGAALGTLIVPIGITEVTRQLPAVRLSRLSSTASSGSPSARSCSPSSGSGRTA